MPNPNAEVLVLDPGLAPADPQRPQVVWAAAGSLDVDRVEAVWQRRSQIDDLATVSGPWGVVLWDPGAAEYLVACDPIGVQPLYWARTSRGAIAVASWLAQLVDRDDVDDALDHEGILSDEGRGCQGVDQLERTRFAAVRRVPGGRAATLRRNGAPRLRTYWDPTDTPAPDESLSLEDCADLLRERIDAAVRRHTAARASYGAHVSGGLDCTAVACRAQQVLGERGEGLVAGYSWAPSPEHVPRFEGDERALLDEVSAAEGFKIRTIHPDESGDWFWERDPNRYAQSTHGRERWTLPQAQADGVHVMLSGWGGDELSSFNGRAVNEQLARSGQWRTLHREMSQVAEVRSGSGPARRLLSFASTVLRSGPEWASTSVDYVRSPKDALKARKVEREVDAQLRAAYPRIADIRKRHSGRFGAIRDPQEYRIELLRNGHIQHRTGWWYQTGRLFDVYYRYPLLDLEVVTAALSLPWWAFKSAGWGRVAYRRAVDPWVPDSVAWNTTKYEPALFWPPETNEVKRAATRRRPPRIDDPKYPETMRLVNATYRSLGKSISSDSRVSARPDAAPR